MALHRPLLLSLLLTLPLGLLPSCRMDSKLTADTGALEEADTDADTDADGDADTDPSSMATPEQLCETLFTLCEDGWGWPDLTTCAEGWLGEGQDWECADIPGYLTCTAACLGAEDCDGFGACEVPCWDGFCL